MCVQRPLEKCSFCLLSFRAYLMKEMLENTTGFVLNWEDEMRA